MKIVSNMFRTCVTICAICAFAAARDWLSFASFPSLAQSSSVSSVGSGASAGSQALASEESQSSAFAGSQDSASAGSQASASTGSQASATATSNAQATADANIELFAHSLIDLLKSSPVLASAGSFAESDPFDLLFDVGQAILERDGFAEAGSANLIAQTAKDLGALSSDLFYSTMAHTLAKFINFHGALTQEVAENVPQEVLKFVEIYANAVGVSDPKSAVNAVGNGFFDYIDLGDLVKYTGVLPFELFAETLQELANGAIA